VLNSRQQTPVAKRTVNPVYNPKDATFDFPIYLSLADQLGVLELVIWDKDMLRKEYLGEVALPLEDWFADKHSGKDRAFGFDQPGNIVRYYKSLIVCDREFIACRLFLSTSYPLVWVLLIPEPSRSNSDSRPPPMRRI